ncbi:uncharacterized protein LOC123552562 isoform X2 [Mercenaria mercenaria]|nr:uncharacterized protein LOC123552562 isoform X2 [Mercenaria mercenaria]
MEAVIPGLPGYSDKLRVANFCALIVEFLKQKKEITPATVNGLNKKVNDLTRLCFKADMLLIYAEDDIELATTTQSDIQNANVQGNGISVELVDSFGTGKPKLSGLKNVFKEYIYVCIVVTKKLNYDEIARFTGEMLLVDSLYNAKGRVISVVTPDRKHEYNAHIEYKTLKPLRYDRGTDHATEQLKLLIQDASETVFKKPNANE